MFFQTPWNVRKIRNHEILSKNIGRKSEPDIVEYILDLPSGHYADEPIIQDFIDSVKKISNIAEQPFSIMP